MLGEGGLGRDVADHAVGVTADENVRQAGRRFDVMADLDEELAGQRHQTDLGRQPHRLHLELA